MNLKIQHFEKPFRLNAGLSAGKPERLNIQCEYPLLSNVFSTFQDPPALACFDLKGFVETQTFQVEAMTEGWQT